MVVFGASVPVSYEGTSDQFNKVKRQPKAVKPKTVTRAEGICWCASPRAPR